MIWAEDNPELIALMEKGRMYVLRGGAPEEPVASSSYLAAFKDLEVGLAPFPAAAKVREGGAHGQQPLRLGSLPRAGEVLGPPKGRASRRAHSQPSCNAVPARRPGIIVVKRRSPLTCPPPQVRAVLLDDVMARPDAPDLGCIINYETRSLR
jgi:hypothetical protein